MLVNYTGLRRGAATIGGGIPLLRETREQARKSHSLSNTFSVIRKAAAIPLFLVNSKKTKRTVLNHPIWWSRRVLGGEDAAQLHKFFGWNNIEVSFGVPFSVKADDCFCTETEMRGHIKIDNAEAHPEWMCRDGEMSWNLKIDKKVAFNVGYGAGKLFRKLQLFEMF